MKKILISLAIAFGLISTTLAQDVTRYGYCPEQMKPEETVALGTGKNKYMEGAICLDPATDPVMKRLEGQQIKGVRVYMRAKYAQAGQGRSLVKLCKGTLQAEATKKICNFNAGWNETLFDTPITIGQEKIYIGMQVFETIGEPYPFITIGGVNVPGGCWVNMGREGWKEMNDRGTLLIQAILEDKAASKLEKCVFAQVASNPLTVLPATPFNAKVYFQNLTNTAVSKVTLETKGQGDTDSHVQQISFEPALAPYDGRVLDLPIRAGKEAGTKQEIILNVTEVNGETAQQSRPGKSYLYITEDAFVRIPVIEEFTSQMCPNCPFMIYYVDKAREAYNRPLLYITHHTGFANDSFTLPGEEALNYLFGDVPPFNPAIMYDRLLFQGESSLALASTGQTSHQPYLDKFNALEQRPAMAQILVDADLKDGRLTARIHGRLNKEQAASGETLYLTAYVLEDGIPLDQYPQQGLDVADAPADLIEGFRHNGIIRHTFTQNILGDELAINGDATFSIDFPAITWDTEWNWENSQVVAFIHKMDKKNLGGNEILNGGSNKYNALVSIDAIKENHSQNIRIFADTEGHIRTNIPVKSIQIYNISGTLYPKENIQTPGIYIVRVQTIENDLISEKIVVR